MLLAANFIEGTTDVYNTNASLVAQFTEPNAPAGYAPFNVQVVNGAGFVMFARQNLVQHDDIPGRGHGLIDTFDPETGSFTRFATGADAGGNLRELNSPCGVAQAPNSFGKHGGDLLVGNFGNGTIMAFGTEGKFYGLRQKHDDAARPRRSHCRRGAGRGGEVAGLRRRGTGSKGVEAVNSAHPAARFAERDEGGLSLTSKNERLRHSSFIGPIALAD